MDPSGDGARRGLRFSFGRFNTDAHVDRALEVVPKVIEKLRQVAAPARGSAVSSVATARGAIVMMETPRDAATSRYDHAALGRRRSDADPDQSKPLSHG